MYRIRRVQSVHRCLVIYLPGPMARELDLARGDYVTISTTPDRPEIRIRKTPNMEPHDHVHPDHPAQ